MLYHCQMVLSSVNESVRFPGKAVVLGVTGKTLLQIFEHLPCCTNSNNFYLLWTALHVKVKCLVGGKHFLVHSKTHVIRDAFIMAFDLMEVEAYSHC